jgi:two-component system NtrC family response regulator/two-component system nitrogen regulation response regulator GlnG
VSFSTPGRKNPQGVRVLIVDDELLVRWSLVETLTAWGHVVAEAGDAAAAVRILTDGSQRPDVVLLDYRLPDSHDLGLLATIRRVAPHTPVILMTAYGTPEVVETALQLGAYRVVSKPFEVHDLAALVVQAHASQAQ